MRTDLKDPSKLSRELFRIKIHHVGGIGGYGPTTALEKLGFVQWVVYDAAKEALRITDKLKGGFLLVNKCIGKDNSWTNFNVTYAKSASSILFPASEAARYTILNSDGTAQIWGEHTKVIKTYRFKTYSLDWLVSQKKVPAVDFLSMDTQGAELAIIDGANNQIQSSIVGVLCETDFSELYRSQPLFCDIQARLREYKFRFCQIYNHQYFNNAPYHKDLQGRGFQVVGESLFLKNPKVFFDGSIFGGIQALKLAAVAVVFDQLDFALEILRILEEKKILSLEQVARRYAISYLKMLRDLYICSKQLEKETPQIAYKSTNRADFGETAGKDFPWIFFYFKKITLILYLLYLKALEKILKKLIGRKQGFYISKISKIYERYGLVDLASVHEKRVISFLLEKNPRKLDRILNLLINFKIYPKIELARRNYFKGKY